MAGDWKPRSRWLAIARKAGNLAMLDRQPQWRPLAPAPGVRVWTDDVSNLPSAVKWRATN